MAELLDRYGLAATFYIPRNSQLETLPEEKIRELSQRFEIGAHTMEHLALTTLPDVEAERQIHDSGAWVADVTGQSCAMFCPPLGKYQREHVNAIARHGFIGYRTVELLRVDPPKRRVRGDYVRGDKGWELSSMPTSVQAHPHPRSVYVRNAIKRASWTPLHYAWTIAGKTDWMGLAEVMLARAAQTGGVFHLWGHSWEIEENEQWKNLEKVFAMLSQAVESGWAVTASNGEVCSAESPASLF
ncbi:putative xylanase/chitin deacetylase [Rhodopirellula islandica]|uniref:Xylanase/chitin deacetylase n=1 Tax=Rhodopirellula islandica TaxID=595434 RepID=A0A0J1BEX5_RHOIS|nr:polysaccharide deacetylase family protein [Rhodopirellula islandica]KLU05056.1 putative xylanase/chitin deacetylase [Rhodopirellula islandica]